MKHTITKKDLDFDNITRLAADHGKGTNKTFDMVVNAVNKRIWYVVVDHNDTIFSGHDIDIAIELYNKI